MRCPQCGTENAPDSRFCGGCGKALSVSRLAPTAKISDDAPIAAPTRPATGPAPYVSYAPPAMPGQEGQQGLTTRPGGHSAPPRTSGERPALRPSGPQPVSPSGSPRGGMYDSTAATAERPLAKRSTPEASNASMSFAPPPRRSTGLIAAVLIVDLALAGAGAFLLAKGLATPENKVEPAPSPTQKTEAPATATPTQMATAPRATPAAPASGSNSSPVSAAPIIAARTKPPRGSSEGAPAGAPSTPGATPPAPPTPAPSGDSTDAGAPPAAGDGSATSPPATAPVSTDSELAALGARSKGAFEGCRGDAIVAGAITIAYIVQPDGSFDHVSAVENTTGNTALAQCLTTVIASWHVTAFDGNQRSFHRTFNYE